MLALALGALIWIASPAITGRQEPWDAKSAYYLVSLVSAGAVAGALQPRRFWLWPVAIYLGQCAAILGRIGLGPDHDLGLFFPLGLIALAVFAVPSLIGSALGAGIRHLVNRTLSRTRENQSSRP